MSEIIDITNKTFGQLRVLKKSDKGQGKRRRVMWQCECSCGTVKDMSGESMRRGMTISCGCIKRTSIGIRSQTHGARVNRTFTREYRSWSGAKSRCDSETNPNYPSYGARGIRMCESWRSDFSEFLKDMGKCPPNTSLDRINVDGNYEPGNCRWVSQRKQCNNKRNSIMVSVNGLKMSLSEAASYFDVSYRPLYHKVQTRGVPLLIAVNEVKTGIRIRKKRIKKLCPPLAE